MTNTTVTQPIFLGGLISYYSGTGSTIYDAYGYAAAVVLTSAINVVLMHPFVLGQLHCGMKIRVAVCSMIYRKALKLSKNALGDTTAGQVVNLISNDVARLDLSIMFVHYLWVGPLETVVVTYLMYREIGISSVIGVAFLLAFIPLQAFLGKKTSSLRLKTALRTDERVRMMNEIIQGIQVIKMYAWEKPFGKMVAMARKKEIKVIRYVSYIRGILLSFIMFTTRVSIFVSLVAFALLGNVVTAEKAFVITAYYNILRQTMTVFFPQGIGQFAETLVSIQRIQKYMLYEEQSDKSSDNTDVDETDIVLKEKVKEKMSNVDFENDKVFNDEKRYSAHLSEAGINVKNVTARWDKENTEETLDNVSLLVQPGTLACIIGPVGSGKSSLIQAILGELKIDAGSIDVNGVVSYASQEPWLFSGTVRSNILFGLPMNKERYNKVVRKCALERDFDLLPYGDKTIVGERGTSLSGGQKARISLARACYREAEIYLLDDPLSAVDTHVGKHLFDQCLRDLLRNKIVILVTHQLQYLQHVDQIVILNHGRVEGVGTYDSLRETGLDFAKLLAAESKDDEKDGSMQKSRSNSKLNRQSSEVSTTSLDDKGNDTAMQVEEKSAEGAIGMSIYNKYFKAGGGFCLFYIMIVFCLMSQLLASGGDYFVSFWVTKEERRQEEIVADSRMFNTSSVTSDSLYTETTTVGPDVGFFSKFLAEIGLRNLENEDRMIDIYIFSAITVATVVITLSRSFLFFSLAMKASTHLHNLMFQGVTRATMFFFNTNPSGRILNRFSKDMGQVDEILPSVMIDVIQIFLSLGGIIVVVAIVNYWFLVPTLIIGVIFYFLRNFYLMTSRNVKRMEATTRSPIYSHLGASLNGLSTIRAFGAQDILVKEFDSLQDLHSSAFYLFISTSRAFGFWLDVWCVVYIAIVTLSFFLMGDGGGNVGLAITQAMGMTGMVQWGMRQSAELENTMTAVERVVEYESVDPEPALETTDSSKKPPAEWPENGEVKFDRLSLRYFPDPSTDLVLKDLEFHIMPKEKVGIVGRTGAGKSSLINALFRLSYNDGSIIIDSRDTNSMGLHDLRTKISIIPQEPVLFSGTMRYNLDPFDDYSDDKLWSALEEVKLKTAVQELPHGLNSRISEGGGNFSIGQRQLVCLARAILRENRILVMDEATANVDPQTDALIQATIRDKFANCTILTIAHRLHTVMDSDKVLVMDAGRAVEFGSPYELLTTKTGPRIFHGMVQETGRGTYDKLFQITKQVHEQRLNKLD
ncbi:hypothetical protein HA402_006945 [Bradysia odoriphaga]|nr:hypothetical protein HA402_006945 [Bradysia odoriphaga]